MPDVDESSRSEGVEASLPPVVSPTRKKKVINVRKSKQQPLPQGDPEPGVALGKSGKPKCKVLVARKAKPGENFAAYSEPDLENKSPTKSKSGRRVMLGEPGDFNEDEFNIDAMTESRVDISASTGKSPVKRRLSVSQLLKKDTQEVVMLGGTHSNSGLLHTDSNVSVPHIDPQQKKKMRANFSASLSHAEDARKKRHLEEGSTRMLANERIAYDREQRALERFNKTQVEWGKFKNRIANRLGKDPDQLVMSRSENFREHIEEYDMIQKATPLHQKHGDKYWLMSLRGEGTRFVPVGNMFSGLFCPVREGSNLNSEIVRRPGKRFHPNKTQTTEFNLDEDPSTQVGLGSSQMHQSQALMQRSKQLQRAIHKIRPHQVDADLAEGLVATGAPLFEWASKSSEAYWAHMEEFDQQQRLEAELNQLQLNMEQETKELQDDCGFLGQLLDGPKLQLGQHFSGDDSQVVGDDHAPRLLFSTGVNVTTIAEIEARNLGNVALTFEWKALEKHSGVNSKSGVGVAITSQNDSFPGVRVVQPDDSRFLCRRQKGVILPGQSISFIFTFKAPIPGEFSEQWQLVTNPPCAMGVDPVSGLDYSIVTMNGTSMEADCNRGSRARLRDEMKGRVKLAQEEKQKEQDRRAEAERLAAMPPSDAEQQQMFTKANPRLFYSKASCDAFSKLYTDVALLVKKERDEQKERRMVVLKAEAEAKVHSNPARPQHNQHCSSPISIIHDNIPTKVFIRIASYLKLTPNPARQPYHLEYKFGCALYEVRLPFTHTIT
jgi:hypothetical protein